MMARTFRDTVPMGLMQALPPLQALPLTDELRGAEDGAEPMMMGAAQQAAQQRARHPSQGALLLPGLAKSLMAVAATAAAGVTLLRLVLALMSKPAGSSAAAGFLSVPWALLVVAAATFLRLPVAYQWRAVTGTMVFMALLVAASAWVLGLGLASPTLSVLGLLVCAVCAMAGWHAGMCVAAASALGIGAVALLSCPSARRRG